jgi:hypothetical protein
MEPFNSFQAMQNRYQELWDPQPDVREKLIARLKQRGMELASDDYVNLDRIATHIVASRIGIPGNVPPQVLAQEFGRNDWISEITALLKEMRSRAGGRPRNDEDADRLLRLVAAANNRPNWKAIACDFEKQTGRAISPEGCRSAVRRYRARQDRN